MTQHRGVAQHRVALLHTSCTPSPTNPRPQTSSTHQPADPIAAANTVSAPKMPTAPTVSDFNSTPSRCWLASGNRPVPPRGKPLGPVSDRLA